MGRIFKTWREHKGGRIPRPGGFPLTARVAVFWRCRVKEVAESLSLFAFTFVNRAAVQMTLRPWPGTRAPPSTVTAGWGAGMRGMRPRAEQAGHVAFCSGVVLSVSTGHLCGGWPTKQDSVARTPGQCASPQGPLPPGRAFGPRERPPAVQRHPRLGEHRA